MFSKKVSTELSNLVATLKSFLRQYLEEQSVAIDQRGYFCCVNPDHSDSNPSMHFVPGSEETKTKCFSCGATYDIYDCHHIFEKAPLRGNAWVHQNVYPLARKFNVPFNDSPPTEQEQLEIDLWRLYDDAGRVFTDMLGQKPDIAFKHTRLRGLRDETCSLYGVGTVQWRTFHQALKASGHDMEFAKEYGIDNSMFGEDHITFIIRDVDGGVVGFTRRSTTYDKATHRALKERGEGHKYPPKYKTTPAKVPFFQPESLLYGLDTAKTYKYRRLDIFEGHPDVISARQVGHMPCVCAAGTELTETQILAAVACGFNHINLVFDYDDAGYRAAKKYLKEFSGIKDLHLTITFLTFGTEVDDKDKDPDGYFRIYGLEAFLKLEPTTAFDYMLHELLADPKVNRKLIASEMIPHILGISDRILRTELIETLSSRTGIAETIIRSEIDRRENVHVIGLADDISRRLYIAKDAESKASVIMEAAAELQGLKDVAPDVSIPECVKAFEDSIKDWETPKSGILGYYTGWEEFDKKFDGIPKREGLIGIAGTANSGKSALVTSMTIKLLAHNPDTVVIYHIMDDPRRIAFAKLVSSMSEIPIGTVLRANSLKETNPTLWDKYCYYRDWIKERLIEGRLVVKGQDLGTGTVQATALIDHIAQETKKTPIYIADSLHNISGVGGGDVESERIKTKRVVEWAQFMSDTKGVTMIFTMEVTKSGMRGRPRMDTTAETAKISFAFKMLGMLYNDRHDMREEATTFWVDDAEDPITGAKPAIPIKRPVLEVNFEKNKITNYKGTEYWKLWDHCAKAEIMTIKDVMKARESGHALKNEPNQEVAQAFAGAVPPAPNLEM